NVFLYPWICWAIWSVRNKKIFNNQDVTPADTIEKAIREAREWQMAQDCKEQQTHQQNPKQTIICSDAAWKEDAEIAGLRWTITNRDLGVLENKSSSCPQTGLPLLAEAKALLAGL
ncbi:unnamed protein product, partial [Thlaspi arvense]